MAYEKPKVVAESEPKTSYVAGCPAQDRGSSSTGKYSCISCERSQ